MASPRDEFDLLLAAPTPVEAEMARELLADAGIPTFSHGRDRDFAELGASIHGNLTRPDLFVPKGRRSEAEALLRAAWDESALSDELALSVPSEPDAVPSTSGSRRAWAYVIGAIVLLAFVVAYFGEFFAHRRTPWE